jgi:(heptosyl)LPS beta-1,4-glucosyltransferase
VNLSISAVIITHNEAQNIERCIRALHSLTDDIVVVDALSEDKTPEICKKQNVRFYQQEWAGYSAQKNYANSLARHPYILSIDADEVVSDALRESIKEAALKGLSGVYSFNRLTNYCGRWIRHSGWYPDVKTRLFPKNATRWEGEFVHETLVFTGAQKETHLRGDLLHYSYQSTRQHRMRADKYSELTAHKMFAAGKKAGWLKPWLSGMVRFIDMYFFKAGFLDGISGYKIAAISAASNVYKYQRLRKLWQKT